MAVPIVIQSLVGSWSGTSTLHRSWLTDETKVQSSDSTLAVSVGGCHAIVRYTWECDGEAQDGAMLISGDNENGTCSMGWTDSWHQSSGVMFVDGTQSGNTLSCSGQYATDENGAWRWRIEIQLDSEGRLVMKMTNIEPDDSEEWAVEATYTRA